MEFPDNCRVCLNWNWPAAMRSPRRACGPAWRHGLCPCRWRTVSTLPTRRLGQSLSCCLRSTSSRCRQVQFGRGRRAGEHLNLICFFYLLFFTLFLSPSPNRLTTSQMQPSAISHPSRVTAWAYCACSPAGNWPIMASSTSVSQGS